MIRNLFTFKKKSAKVISFTVKKIHKEKNFFNHRRSTNEFFVTIICKRRSVFLVTLTLRTYLHTASMKFPRLEHRSKGCRNRKEGSVDVY